MNIEFRSPGLVSYYKSHRKVFTDLYPSEQAAFEFLAPRARHTILDLGSACGGLGWALFERFGCSGYTGLEIHADAAREGNQSVEQFGGCVLAGDIMEASRVLESNSKPLLYDAVVSLSAVDWNVDVEANVRSAWSLVKLGGHLVVSLRLHPTVCINNIRESFQPTTPESNEADEVAPYVIISVKRAIDFATSLNAGRITVFGRIGEPSVTAVTPIKEVIFIVAVVEKGLRSGEPVFDVQSPALLRDLVESKVAFSHLRE